MRFAELCYAKWEHRSLRDETACHEVADLGFAKVPGEHASFYVPDARVDEIKSVIVDLNTKYNGSLWICWWDDARPKDPCERWYPDGLTR